MKIKLLVVLVIVILSVLFLGSFFLFPDLLQNKPYVSNKQNISNEFVKLDVKSIFNVYGTADKFEINNGEKIWHDPKFEFNPENDVIYRELFSESKDNAVVISPLFTFSAYSEPGFYNYFRDECDESCLTVQIQDDYVSEFTSSGNGLQVLKLLKYEIISDIDVDKNPQILEKYDKVIVLHNEYVTKKEFDAITSHPNVLYLYPNALYAEIEVNYQNNSIMLVRGHNFPDVDIKNGFDWKYDNSPLEYDVDCKDMGFTKIENGWMLNCYPEKPIHQSKVLLKMIKDLKI